MSRFLGILGFLAVVILPTTLSAQATDESAAEQQARAVAEPWLASLDQGRFDESWEVAAPVFQQGVTMEQWSERMRMTRETIGPVVARSFSRAAYASDLPNAPEGEYVMVEFLTRFENVDAAEEAVILIKGDDGAWRVAGASVRPAR